MGETEASDLLVGVRDLKKHYGSIRAVDGISFEVRRGDVLGFLGPNGAGKTTAMKMITGFLEPDGGAVEVAGWDVASHSLEVRKRIGYLPENAPAYGEMTVEGFLDFVSAAREIESPGAALERALDLTELRNVKHQTIETLSKGFKRRVGLAQALIHDPEILILDEPTDGLDPNQKALVQELLTSLSEGRCIILSTHVLDEAEKICNRAVIISEGKILVDSTPRQLVAQAPSHNVMRLTLAPEDRERVKGIFDDQQWCQRADVVAPTMLDIYPVGGESHLEDVPRLLEGIEVLAISQREGRLDELFREMTKGISA